MNSTTTSFSLRPLPSQLHRIHDDLGDILDNVWSSSFVEDHDHDLDHDEHDVGSDVSTAAAAAVSVDVDVDVDVERDLIVSNNNSNNNNNNISLEATAAHLDEAISISANTLHLASSFDDDHAVAATAAATAAGQPTHENYHNLNSHQFDGLLNEPLGMEASFYQCQHQHQHDHNNHNNHNHSNDISQSQQTQTQTHMLPCMHPHYTQPLPLEQHHYGYGYGHGHSNFEDALYEEISHSSSHSSSSSSHDDLEPVPIEPSRVTIVAKLDTDHLIHRQQQLSRRNSIGCQTAVNHDEGVYSMLDILRPLVLKRKLDTTSSSSSSSSSSLSQADPIAATTNTPDEEQVQCQPRLLQAKRRKLSTVSVGSASDAEEATAAVTASSTRISPNNKTKKNSSRIRCHQETQWDTRFQELLDFKSNVGHCSVPHSYKLNPQLAQWVKRQRYQYKLKTEGRHSTLTHDRQQALEQVGFVWDSHHALWEERFQELIVYKTHNGHCIVPARYKANPPLAVWVKCQRRQFKLLNEGQRTNITQHRIDRLKSVGFCWNPRSGA